MDKYAVLSTFHVHPRLAPPRTSPPSVAGDLAALTCYFNPCGYRSRRAHYERFAQGLASQGVPLFTAELAFDDRPFVLNGPAGVQRFRSRHVLWHKERLLNLLVRSLPERYDKIAWIDADLLFDNPDWPALAAATLERVPVAQLFDRAVHLGPDDAPQWSVRGVAWGHRHRPRTARDFGRYHPGFAWAARRELLEAHGLLDHHVLGGADSVMACAMFGWWTHSMLAGLHPALRERTLDWARSFWRDVRGQVDHVPGRVRHLWHGERGDRRYNERREWLARFEFDPWFHLCDGAAGLWEWRETAAPLADRVRRYFHERREDGVDG